MIDQSSSTVPLVMEVENVSECKSNFQTIVLSERDHCNAAKQIVIYCFGERYMLFGALYNFSLTNLYLDVGIFTFGNENYLG